MQKGLKRQRAREPRIRIPPSEEVVRRLPPDSWGRRWPRVVWSQVCYGHQPELTDAWFTCVLAFRQETGLDPVLQQSIFWVVTRSQQCFY